MIDHASGVEASVGPYGSEEPYYEYLAPKISPLFTGNPNERYIEALTNDRFAMHMKIPAKFDFKKYNAVGVNFFMDGNNVCNFIVDKADVEHGYSWTTDSILEAAGSKWQKVGFTFGELKVVEEALSESEEVQESSTRGKIEIMFQLGNTKTTWTTERTDCRSWETLGLETSKKVAVDHARSHSAKKLLLEMDSEDHDMTTGSWSPAKGKNGKMLVFTFFYASRMILELKKVIPATLSGPVAAEPRVVAKPTESVLLAPTTASLAHGLKYGDKCDQDDEEVMIVPPPSKRTTTIKAEPIDDVEIVSCEPVRKKIKTEPVEDRANARSNISAMAFGSKGKSAQGAKAREKARIQLELKEIKLRRRLMELEDLE